MKENKGFEVATIVLGIAIGFKGLYDNDFYMAGIGFIISNQGFIRIKQ